MQKLLLLVLAAGPVLAQARREVFAAPLVPQTVSTEQDSLRLWSLRTGAPAILIENQVYLPQCVCDAGWCSRQRGGGTEQRQGGGDSEGRTVGGQSEGRRLGGQAEGRQVGGQAEGRQVGGQAEERRVGGQTEGRQTGGQGEGRQVGGQVEGRQVGGQSEGRQLGGQAEGRSVGGQTEGRSGGGQAAAFQCSVNLQSYGKLTLIGVRAGLKIQVYDGRTLREVVGPEVVF